MPPLASTVLDTNAIDLLSAWITNDLPSWQPFPGSETAQIDVQAVGSTAQVSFVQNSNRAYEVQSSAILTDPLGWTVLDVDGNEPFFSVTNRPWSVTDPSPILSKRFYRVRVFAP